MVLLLDWLLPMNIEDELFTGLYSKIDPYLLSEVVDLLFTKSSIKKSFINLNCLKKKKSNDFTDVYFYLTFQSIPKVQIKIAEPEKNQSKRNY